MIAMLICEGWEDSEDLWGCGGGGGGRCWYVAKFKEGREGGVKVVMKSHSTLGEIGLLEYRTVSYR